MLGGRSEQKAVAHVKGLGVGLDSPAPATGQTERLRLHLALAYGCSPDCAVDAGVGCTKLLGCLGDRHSTLRECDLLQQFEQQWQYCSPAC